jgi:hypothetical protein
LFDINAIGRAVRTMELHEMCVLEGLNLWNKSHILKFDNCFSNYT